VTEASGDKLEWQGRVVSIQPRILLLRSFDQPSHSYLGYSLHHIWMGRSRARSASSALASGWALNPSTRSASATSSSVCPCPWQIREPSRWGSSVRLCSWAGAPPPTLVESGRLHSDRATRCGR